MAINAKISHWAVIAVGSNNDAAENVEKAVCIMREHLDILKMSRQLNTEPIGMPQGTPAFVNMIVICHCDIDTDHLTALLKKIERQCGNTPEKRKHGIVSVDLDLLMFDDIKFHLSDWNRWYIKQLTEELHI